MVIRMAVTAGSSLVGIANGVTVDADGKSLVRQRFRRRSAERVAVGRLERSFRGTGDGSLWQPDDERATRTRALGKHQPTLVTLDDLPGDRQPETGTLRELAGAPVEALEDPVPILVGDSGTLVTDCDDPGPALPAASGDGDRGALRCQADRVGQQVRHSPVEGGRIGVDDRTAR
jgi:hypothetical protein